MRAYDTTLIINPQLEETGLNGRIAEMVGVIEAQGGRMIKENRIGLRRMAYDIQKLSQGYYVSLVYEGDGALVKELERRLRIDESCLRFLTCQYQEVSESPFESRPSTDRIVEPKFDDVEDDDVSNDIDEDLHDGK